MKKMFSLLLCLLAVTVYGKPKVYDCFMFLNEFEILDIRLNELYDHVDKFVIVESGFGHRFATPKPYHFEEQKDRYAKFMDKIIYVKLDKLIETDDPWLRENWQRNQIMQGLQDAGPDDLIFISDVDEFIPGDLIPKIYEMSEKTPQIVFNQKMYRWVINRFTNEPWRGTTALRFKHLLLITPQEARLRARFETYAARYGGAPVIDAGWHFSGIGGYKRVVEKLLNMVEGPPQMVTADEFKAKVEAIQLVAIDETFPKYIQNNQERYLADGLIDPIPSGAEYLIDKIASNNRRFATFLKALQLMNERQSKVIVETGTARGGKSNFEGDGGSTLIFAEWASKNNGTLYSVDIDKVSLSAAARDLGTYQAFVHLEESDSVEYLKSFNKPIDFLYLDSYVYDFNNPAPSQQYRLSEIIAAEPWLGDNSVVMIDDCDLYGGGTGKLAIEYLLQKGWQVIAQDYQVILTKKAVN